MGLGSRGISRTVVVLGVVIALGVTGVGLSLFALDRFENVPAWQAHPERISKRTGPDGRMTPEFAYALYRSTMTSDDYERLWAVADGRGSPADRVHVARLNERYLARAREFGFGRDMASRQFIWSAAGICECLAYSEASRRTQQRLEAAIAAGTGRQPRSTPA